MKRKPKCAYCGKEGRSKEHIFPGWLLRKTPTYELKFNKTKGRVSPDENTVRDVCKPCNNGPLSQLDDYARVLYETYWSKIVREEVEFEYDYIGLTRWLLKVSFNSARQQKSSAKSFEALIPYMLGEDLDPPGEVLFFLDVIRPFEGMWGGENVVIEPRDHRCGKMFLKDIPSFKSVREGRFIAIDSFYFYIMFLDAPGDEAAYGKIAADISPSCVRLTAAAQAVTIQPTRDYLEMKLPEVGMNLDAYLEGYHRFVVKDKAPKRSELRSK
jgi:hypothetical protein